MQGTDKDSRKCGRTLCHCFLDAFLMGAGSEELSLTEMSIETATGQRDNKNSDKTVGPDSLEQRSPVGNVWADIISTHLHCWGAA